MAFGVKPYAKSRLRVLLRQVGGAQERPEDGEADMIGAAAGQRAGCSQKAAGAPARDVKLSQQRVKIFGYCLNQTSRRRAVREFGVTPEVAKHLQKVRFAAAEEAADPCATLAGPAQIVEKRAYNPLDAIRILPLADESRKLAPQLLHTLFVFPVRYSCLTLVDEGMC